MSSIAKNPERTDEDAKASEGFRSLLPSVFPNERQLDVEVEGYEGDRLHQMFLSADRSTTARKRSSILAEDDGDMDLRGEEIYDSGVATDRPAQFEPFFTLVEDQATGEQHHPYVHYVFSDDDPDLMTSAFLHTIDPNTLSTDNDSRDSSSTLGSRSENNRYIIVDVAADGHSIVSAQSLAPDWQVLNTQVSIAPTFNENSTPEEAGLMLRIEGVNSPPGDGSKSAEDLIPHGPSATNEAMISAMNNLAQIFHRDMESLKKLTEASDSNRSQEI